MTNIIRLSQVTQYATSNIWVNPDEIATYGHASGGASNTGNTIITWRATRATMVVKENQDVVSLKITGAIV